MTKELNNNKQIELSDGRTVTLVLPNWFGFAHDKVNDHFGGDLSYVATMSIKGGPVAVYHAANPDRAKGHKDYMLLWTQSYYNKMIVSGLSAEDMEEHRYQQGKLCPSCMEVVYSVTRHDYRHCSCDAVMVDGGRDYFRTSIEGIPARIDFLNMEIRI